jgi:hypothetical protein
MSTPPEHATPTSPAPVPSSRRDILELRGKVEMQLDLDVTRAGRRVGQDALEWVPEITGSKTRGAGSGC